MGFRYNKQHSSFWSFSMALSTPKGTPTSSDSPTAKVTSRESNSRPPHQPFKCTDAQQTKQHCDPNGHCIQNGQRSCMHYLGITNTSGTFRIVQLTVDSGAFIWIAVAFTSDLYSPHDPTIFCKLLPLEV